MVGEEKKIPTTINCIPTSKRREQWNYNNIMCRAIGIRSLHFVEPSLPRDIPKGRAMWPSSIMHVSKILGFLFKAIGHFPSINLVARSHLLVAGDVPIHTPR